jgi:hypothetical protein
MEHGGNLNFRKFMSQYGLEKMNIHKKYYTVATKFYRNKLDALTNKNESFEDKAPSIEEGKKIEGLKSNHLEIKSMGFGSDDLLPKPKKPKRSRSRFKEGWEKGKKKMEKWGNSISKKFGKIFKRSKSKSKKKKKQRKEEEEVVDDNDDISASNDSYFEIKNMKKKKEKQSRFDDDLISFKKKNDNIPAKPFNGWKKYLEKPSKSKLDAKYQKRIRAFKSQNSKNSNEEIKNTIKKLFPISHSDTEKIEKKNFEANELNKKMEKCNINNIEAVDGDYQDPFFKKENVKQMTSIK